MGKIGEGQKIFKGENWEGRKYSKRKKRGGV